MRRLSPYALMLGLGLLGACSAYQEPRPSVTLPRDAVQGATDPLRASVAFTSNVFGAPRRLAGQPAVAARAIASMEFIAVDLPENARVLGTTAATVPQLAIARPEWRAAVGIAPDAPPQQVVNLLFAAARQLDYGDQQAALRALTSPIFTKGPEGTLAALSDLPPLPLTNAAAVNASQMLQQFEGVSTGRR